MKTMLTASLVSICLSSAAAYADTKLTLVEVITSPDRTKILQQNVDRFEAENPGIKVDIISLPWGQAFEKLATMVASGQTPDVVELPEIWQGLYASSGKLESLEPYMKEWKHIGDLTPRAIEMARRADNTAYMVPYGFYLRAMFWNKKLFAQAGLDHAPKTMAEFESSAKKISALGSDISGYCLRGGAGGTNAWLMFMSAMKGSADIFDQQGNSTLASPGAIKGAEFMIDMYKNGYAPKDSVNWGFNEIVSGFYSGKCAMLDQDPDALIAISKNMDNEDFAVAAMPVGPSGKAFPTIGYVGWAMFNDSEAKDESWKLISHLSGPVANLEWTKFVGVLPIYKEAVKDPYYATEQFSGWFEQLGSDNYVPLAVPAYLKEWGYFNSVMVKDTSQEALLGQRSASDMANEWSKYLSKAQKSHLNK